MSVLGLAVALPIVAATAAAQHELRIPAAEGAHSATVTLLGDGSLEVRTTGEDPYVLFGRVPLPFDHERLRVFAFEYRADEGLDFFEIFFHSESRGWASWHGPVVDPSPLWRPGRRQQATQVVV